MANLLCLKCGSLVGLITEAETHDCGCGNTTEFFKVSDVGALQMKERKIFFIIGPTGAGKNYLTEKLKALDFENVPSVTNRPLRKGEIPGEDYINITHEEMDKLKESNNLCEHIKFGFYDYGVSKPILLDKIWNSTKNLILIVEPNGYEQMLIWFDRNSKLLGDLKFGFYSIFLNIDRVTRFFNLLSDIGCGGNYSNAEQGAYQFDILINKERYPEDYEKFSKMLDRFVRNGDDMVELFESKKWVYGASYKSLEDKKMPINQIEIKTRKGIDDFVLGLKFSDYGMDSLLKNLENINDPETLKYILKTVQNKLVVVGTKN